MLDSVSCQVYYKRSIIFLAFSYLLSKSSQTFENSFFGGIERGSKLFFFSNPFLFIPLLSRSDFYLKTIDDAFIRYNPFILGKLTFDQRSLANWWPASTDLLNPNAANLAQPTLGQIFKNRCSGPNVTLSNECQPILGRHIVLHLQ